MSEMLKAKDYISLVRQRGSDGKTLERVFRNMLNSELFRNAYGKLYRNKGSMTPGIDGKTPDGMSLTKIDALIEELRTGKFRWTPSRRVNIEKGKGKIRPLSLPTWKDKLVQEVMRVILEAYYEPQFSTHSHGYRPKRGCHTALKEVSQWGGVKWFVEGDVKGCFD
jgi:retron-type reverse transcriptase